MANDPALELDSPLRALPGIGPKRGEALAEAGYETVEDALFHLPFRYEDRARTARIADLTPGIAATIRARVSSSRLIRTRRRGFTIMEAVLDDGTASLKAVWYNQPYLNRVLEAGREGFFFGEPKTGHRGLTGLSLDNPEIEMLEEGTGEQAIHTARIVPVYRAVGGLGARAWRRLMWRALEALNGRIEDYLPAALRRRLHLTWRASALRGAHFPPAETSLDDLNAQSTPFHRRLIFEEFLVLQLGLALRRQQAHQEERGFQYRFTEETRRKVRALMPFKLTDGQQRVLAEIRDDLESNAPMNRLLQGDVGSGKTAVAAIAMAIAAENGLQAALMVPTEILAAQHHRALSRLLGPGGWRIDLLTGSTRGAARRRVLETVASGETSILVGTHALIGKEVEFSRLGLVVVDEQHRFGVVQRSSLRRKGWRPDTLVMTATPIPRSLALTVYGDLDYSVLDEMPPGRETIKTLLRREEHRERVWEGIQRELERGRQAFVVYPLVEESSRSDMKSAVEMAELLQDGPFTGWRVGCVHGRLPRAKRDEIMQDFARREIHVLVATTVVEVGIDVPNATVLLVEHPERFGLSQLHQLRGRVGRGREKSYCILMVTGEIGREAERRLDVLVNESDGFRIAERDMEMRGPGDMLGTRQHGVPALRVGSLVRDGAVMSLARREAGVWVERVASGEAKLPDLLTERLARRWRDRLDLTRVG